MQRIWKRFVRVLLAFVVLWGAAELWNAIDVEAQQRTRRRTTNRGETLVVDAEQWHAGALAGRGRYFRP